MDWYHNCGKISFMETNLNIEVANLDRSHRRALEEVLGRSLASNQRLLISVLDAPSALESVTQSHQPLDDWLSVYDGLSEQEIEQIDQIAKTRANLFPRYSSGKISLSSPTQGGTWVNISASRFLR